MYGTNICYYPPLQVVFLYIHLPRNPCKGSRYSMCKVLPFPFSNAHNIVSFSRLLTFLLSICLMMEELDSSRVVQLLLWFQSKLKVSVSLLLNNRLGMIKYTKFRNCTRHSHWQFVKYIVLFIKSVSVPKGNVMEFSFSPNIWNNNQRC